MKKDAIGEGETWCFRCIRDMKSLGASLKAKNLTSAHY